MVHTYSMDCMTLCVPVVHYKALSGINSSGTKVTSKVSLMFCVLMPHPGPTCVGHYSIGDSFQRAVSF